MVFLLLVTISFACRSNDSNTLPAVKTIFATAYELNGDIITEPPFEVEWEAIAPPHIRDIDIQNPSQKVLDLLRVSESWGTAVLEFEVPVNAQDKKNYECYLISPQGSSELDLNQLRGKARFPLFKGKPTTKPQYYGHVATSVRTPGSVTEGGFVVCGTRPELDATRKPDVTPEAIKKYFQADDSIKSDTRIADDDFWKVLKAFIFTLPNQPSSFAFFQLAPDIKCSAGCCEQRFFIVRVDDFKGIAWSLSKCDV